MWHRSKPGINLRDEDWLVRTAKIQPQPIRVRHRLGDIQRAHEFLALEEAIEKSKGLLRLEPDFDGLGSEPPSEETWQRARDFLGYYCEWVRLTPSMSVDVPRITAGPNRSVDLHWKTRDYELLVNIPENPKGEAAFYGDNYGKQRIEGKFDLGNPNVGLLAWLKKLE